MLLNLTECNCRVSEDGSHSRDSARRSSQNKVSQEKVRKQFKGFGSRGEIYDWVYQFWSYWRTFARPIDDKKNMYY